MYGDFKIDEERTYGFTHTCNRQRKPEFSIILSSSLARRERMKKDRKGSDKEEEGWIKEAKEKEGKEAF